MILAHLADLHLGHRAYHRKEGGRNVREADVVRAFQGAIQELVRIRPDLVLMAGDIFDAPTPPPGALVALSRNLELLRSALPDVPALLVAGARDTPRSPGEPGVLAALDVFPNVEAATGTARSVFLRDRKVHVLLAPHGAILQPPHPELRPHPEARWNILLAHAQVREGSGAGLPLDPRSWDYVALGSEHRRREVSPRIHYPGSLERVTPDPWDEALERKGFLTYDLARGESRFHPVLGRPVVALAPIKADPADPEALDRRIRKVVSEVPGGIEGKMVRLRIEGIPPWRLQTLDRALLASIRARALHLAIEVGEGEGARVSVADRGPRGAERLLSMVDEELAREEFDVDGLRDAVLRSLFGTISPNPAKPEDNS